MRHVHRAKEAQGQRTAEQALRNHQIEEAKKVYTTFSELPLEIVVDVRSFTVTHPAEPEEIVLPETRSGSFADTTQGPVLEAPSPHVRMRGVKSQVSKVVAGKKPSVSIFDSVTNTILKTTSSKKNK